MNRCLHSLLIIAITVISAQAIDSHPSLTVGVGPYRNSLSWGAHFQSSIGAWLFIGNDHLLRPAVEYQLDNNDDEQSHSIAVGAHFLSEDYLNLGWGAQYVVGGLNTEIHHGFKLSVQAWAILSVGVDLSYQYLDGGNFQCTFIFDLMTIGYMIGQV